MLPGSTGVSSRTSGSDRTSSDAQHRLGRRECSSSRQWPRDRGVRLRYPRLHRALRAFVRTTVTDHARSLHRAPRHGLFGSERRVSFHSRGASGDRFGGARRAPPRRVRTLAFTCVGAYLAPLIAASRAELVRRVILIEAPSWEEGRRWARRIDFDGKRVVATPYVGQVLVRVFRKRIASRWFAKSLAPGRAEPFAATAVAAFDAGAAWALASLVQSYFADAQPELPVLRVPTLQFGRGGSNPSPNRQAFGTLARARR